MPKHEEEVGEERFLSQDFWTARTVLGERVESSKPIYEASPSKVLILMWRSSQVVSVSVHAGNSKLTIVDLMKLEAYIDLYKYNFVYIACMCMSPPPSRLIKEIFWVR